ncbi:MAG: TolC family protein [Spirochaetales bacterium]|nr:TolC family protein [Spirochaetales bacterium]
MKNTIIFIFTLFTSMLYGQSVIKEMDILNLLDKNNFTYQSALLNKEVAYQNHMMTLSNQVPQLEFTTDPNSLGHPLYSYQVSRDLFSGEELMTHRIGAGLSLKQQVPGGGNLSLGFKNRLDIKNTADDNEPEYSQTPNVSLIYNQPLLYNNGLIDPGIHEAKNQLSQIGYLKSENNTKNLKNSLIYSAYSFAAQVQGLRKNRSYLEESIRIHTEDLKDLIIKKEQGRASETDILSLKLNIGKKTEQLLENRYILQEAEQNLRLFLGLESNSEQWVFDLEYGEINFPGEESKNTSGNPDFMENIEKMMTHNAQIQLQELLSREVSLLNRLAGLDYASFLNVFISATPLYPRNRDNPEDFNDSFTGLWHSEGGLDLSAGLALTIPLFNGGKNKMRSIISRNNEQISLLALDETKEKLKNTFNSLLFRRQILREQIEQIKLNIDYENIMLQKESDLYVLGGSTQNELVRLELDMISLENKLLQKKSELFLNTLDISSLLGYDLEGFITENM